MPIRKKLVFVAPKKVEIYEEFLGELADNQVLVETILSAISPGTEMLVFRGQFPDLNVDTGIKSLEGKFCYPLTYGYACVGRITQVGKSVSREWLDRLVFSFQPHCSHFVAIPEILLPLPEGFSPQTACFLANTETAVNLVQDAAPILGERALVLGQGIVGLLTAALLSEFPLEKLICVDLFRKRQLAAEALGVKVVLDPCNPGFLETARKELKRGADLTFELSGQPAVLDVALSLTTFSGRILIGSWYGEKRAPINFGGEFHRSRIKLISSQVSTIAPELTSRWDKARRFEVAWQALSRIHPEKWISHRFPFNLAHEAYTLLDQKPEDALQIIFEY